MLNSLPNPALACMLSAVSMVTADDARAQVREPTELIDPQHCMFCHAPNVRFLAPSLRQIAERYRDMPNAGEMLDQELRRGGRARWGGTPVPTAPERGGPLSSEHAHTLIQRVMSQ
ncbi:cytochrome C [Burkholderia sp. ABCPW 14]|uniref:c-type cytochrome n=1 Tax=Burkholderia sp. ABCPW 14 TaxID=1637860 RepID=UPI000770DBA5|nr:cytochrome C [Burkholderia sp. ABCPW 14]KVD89609.1 cytochrome C [Burkholderia sp. ABCPW 14]